MQKGREHIQDVSEACEPRSQQRKLLTVLMITVLVMIVELIGGILANSLSLLSDAGHMLTDVLAIGLSTLAISFSRRPPTVSKTFGFYRLEILAAFFNGILLFGISCYIFFEAYNRFIHPEAVKGVYMLGVAVLGLVANVASILILKKSFHGNLNIRSAFYHIIGDTISSAGVISGGLVILFTGWFWVDSLISVLIGLLILRGAYGLVNEATDILLEATPKSIDVEMLIKDLSHIQGVIGVHHLHLWTLTSGIYAMSAHVMIKDILTSKSTVILKEIKSILRDKYRMDRTTIQFETETCCDEDDVRSGTCGWNGSYALK